MADPLRPRKPARRAQAERRIRRLDPLLPKPGPDPERLRGRENALTRGLGAKTGLRRITSGPSADNTMAPSQPVQGPRYRHPRVTSNAMPDAGRLANSLKLTLPMLNRLNPLGRRVSVQPTTAAAATGRPQAQAAEQARADMQIRRHASRLKATRSAGRIR